MNSKVGAYLHPAKEMPGFNFVTNQVFRGKWHSNSVRFRYV